VIVDWYSTAKALLQLPCMQRNGQASGLHDLLVCIAEHGIWHLKKWHFETSALTSAGQQIVKSALYSKARRKLP
jgi:hypothetical protein